MKQNLWKKATSVAMSIVLAAGLCPALAVADGGGLQAANNAIGQATIQEASELADGKYTVDLANSFSMFKVNDHEDATLEPYVVISGDDAQLVLNYRSSKGSAWRYGQIKWGAYDDIDQTTDGFAGVPQYKEGKSEADGNSDDTVYAMKFVMPIAKATLAAAIDNKTALPYTVRYVPHYDETYDNTWYNYSKGSTFTLSNLVKVSDSTHTTYPPTPLADGEYSLPNMISGPGEMFNHMEADSKKLTVSGDKATISFTQDGSTLSVGKYSRIALGKSSELVTTAYQPDLAEGTAIFEGNDAGKGVTAKGEETTKWAFEVEVSKTQAAALYEGERLYIIVWNREGSSTDKVPGWYKASNDIYLTFDPAKVLDNDKNDAIDELSKYVDSNAYRAAQKAEVDDEVAAGNAAISAAVNAEGVNSALAAAEKKIDQIKTDAQLTAEEKAAAEAKAAEEKAAEEKAAAANAGLATGKSATVGSGAKAATVKATSKTAVTYTAPAKKSTKTLTVPDTVTVNGKQYKVTKVAANAFKGSKATSVTVGKNVTVLAANAFKGASKLTKVTITSKSLNSKKAVKNAFKGSKVKTVTLKGMTAKQKKAVKNAILKYGGKKVTVK